MRGSSRKREEWNPNVPMMGGEKRRQPAAMYAGCMCRKCWHFDL